MLTTDSLHVVWHIIRIWHLMRCWHRHKPVDTIIVGHNYWVYINQSSEAMLEKQMSTILDFDIYFP